MYSSRRNFISTLCFALATPYKLLSSTLFISHSSDAEADQFFPSSIASGDPDPRGVILWTRLNPDCVTDSGEHLYFQIAGDPAFKNILHLGLVEGTYLSAEHDYTVKVDLVGEADLHLEPATRYYYRFVYRGIATRIGRFKTLPHADQDISRLRYAVLSCQDYSSGYYNAFAHLATEDLDFVVHLGDFIYEHQRFPVLRDHVRSVPIPHSTALNLDDFRTIFKTYRSDKNLQRAMEQHTWIISTDDHETANNCYWDYAENSLGLPEGHPLAKSDRAARNNLKLAAQKAWAEYVPARVRFDASATNPLAALKIFRKFAFGNLAEFFMCDSRTYRSKPPHDTTTAALAPNYAETKWTMLGSEQKNWLVKGMAQSTATWKIWGNQTLLSQFGVTDRLSNRTVTLLAGYDAWDGYQGERTLILRELKAQGVENLFVLTGDIHAYISSYVKLDYGEASNSHKDNVVGYELVVPAVTSPNLSKILRLRAEVAKEPKSLVAHLYRVVGGAYTKGPLLEKILDENLKLANPHFKDFGAVYNGYTVVEMSKKQAVWWVYHCDSKNVDALRTKKQLVRSQRYVPALSKIENLV